MQDIAGKVAMVVGATGQLGTATVRALAAKGARVAVLHRNTAAIATQLVAELGGTHRAVQADITDPTALSAAVDEIEAELGPVAIAVNAAHPHLDPVAVADAAPDVIAVHLAAVAAHAALCARVVPGMRQLGYGRIVYFSGALMARAVPGFGPYGAAKAAATTLTRYLAFEEGRHGILANVVAPGRVVDGDDDADLSPEWAEAARQLRARMALPEFPTSVQVAAAVLALVETDSITGQVLWVTGGEPIWT
jgi:NAD(P)-dependent dehydrogenase (short-subunit alcohol dehydrogenase family)